MEKLTDIFSIQQSLFHIHYNCLKLTKSNANDYVTFTGFVNCKCEKFQLQSLAEDKFICLIFIAGLQFSQDTDIRMRLLSKLDQEKNVTVKNHTTKCQCLLSLKQDTMLVQHSTNPSTTSSIWTKGNKPNTTKKKDIFHASVYLRSITSIESKKGFVNLTRTKQPTDRQAH